MTDNLKIVTIVGARPQFVKAAAVSREVARTAGLREVIVHTGQHFDRNMSEVFFEEMEIPRPDHFLDVHSLDHGAMTGRMLEKIEAVLTAERPDAVLVYGDTNSTLAGALAARKLHLRVVHVEAGLRSFNMAMPEEVNRVLADRISDVLCCPTDNAIANLKREGFDHFRCTIVKTGDVMQDAVMHYSALAASRSTIAERLGLDGDFALCTIHRAENTDDPVRLQGIVAALNAVSERMRVVLPLHPRTRKLLRELDLSLGFEPVEPVGYFDMMQLLERTRIVFTDSGGLQKEAFFFSKPCVTLRDETEWVELVQCGMNLLVGADRERIVAGFDEMLGRPVKADHELYGGGTASARIVSTLLELGARAR